MNRLLLSSLLILGSTFETTASKVRQDGHVWEQLDPEGKVLLSWSVEGDLITFEMEAQTTGFVGFGISPTGGMTDADIFIGGVYPNGTAYHEDRFGVGPTEPYPDDNDDWELLEARENETSTYLKFSRLLNTCDEQDYPIGEDTNRIIWAIGLTDDVQYHEERKGAKSLYLLGTVMPEIDLNQTTVHTMSIDTVMPRKDTTYWCSWHRGPVLSEKHHIVAFDTFLPNLVSLEHTHHLTLLNCIAPPDSNVTLEELLGNYTVDNGHMGDECYTEGPFIYCSQILYVWAKGGERMLFPENVGYPIGVGDNAGQPNFYMLEIHFDNPNLKEGVQLETGVSYYYTNEIRTHDAATLTLSHLLHASFTVPPTTDDFVVVGHCGGECTDGRIPIDGIQVFNVLLHAHLSGRKMTLRHFRDGTELPWMEYDHHFDFDYQLNRPLKNWKTILPGDHLSQECTYSSVWKYPRVVMGGLSSQDEMCEAFLWYYPKMDGLDVCASAFDEDTALRQYGATAWRDLVEPGSMPTVYIEAPPELEGPLEAVLNTKFNWTEAFKRQIETLRRYGQHMGYCIDSTYRNPPFLYNVAYPEYGLAYEPIDTCQVVPTTTLSPEFCIDKVNGHYPHPTDPECAMYIRCEDGVATLLRCPEPLLFDPETLTCREDVMCIHKHD